VWLSPTTQLAQSRAEARAPVAQRAATLPEYRVRVREAAGMLEELAAANELVTKSQSHEVWSREGFSSDFAVELPKKERAAFFQVRGLLPPRERVEWGGGSFIEADNSWLHAELTEPERPGDYERRAVALRASAGRLRSLDARLAELEGGVAEPTDRDAERGRLNAILRGREFDREAGRQEGGALRRLVERFVEWVLSLLPRGARVTPGASPRASLLTQFVVFGLCLAVLAYVARLLWLRRRQGVRSLKLKRGARVVLGERLEADQTASDLLDDAERLARAGDLRGAIRKAYVALLCELGDRGVVRLAQHKTNRDYLNAVRRAERPGLYTEILPLTFDFEVHWYGLRPASDADWDSFRTRCRKVLSKQ
ncbi:MAG TPA: DUF4129 domain-containing protein, partial [Pyrinomonadaceae bacterium]